MAIKLNARQREREGKNENDGGNQSSGGSSSGSGSGSSSGGRIVVAYFKFSASIWIQNRDARYLNWQRLPALVLQLQTNNYDFSRTKATSLVQRKTILGGLLLLHQYEEQGKNTRSR